MRIIRHGCLLAALFMFAGTQVCLSAEGNRSYPLPMDEMAEVLQKWWGSGGFQVQRSIPQPGLLMLYAKKGGESWQVRLVPRSPLATRVTVQYSGENRPLKVQELWDHISHYIVASPVDEPRGRKESIPSKVLARIESVVCIDARAGKKDSQFSGFIVDREGLVLSTAHGLRDTRDLEVTFYDGRAITGTVLFKDPRLDLALIHIHPQGQAAISVTEGRNLLGMGESVFTVGCPVNLRGTFYAGTINGPPRRVKGLPLWQADMEVYPGSSGSPVFDAKGNLVAMIKGRYRGIATVGFLIPLETIIQFFQENRPAPDASGQTR
jgi:serine protease Do